jgi:hypothetical protein
MNERDGEEVLPAHPLKRLKHVRTLILRDPGQKKRYFTETKG